MPCAAPCDRLPCDERCSKTLVCGHKCPGLWGERCAEEYCQACGSRANNRVDLLEFKSYKDIDLDETPIVVLGCGHFFTAESLDGLMKLGDMYSTDLAGRFCGLLYPSALLPVPCCPDCKRPIRQFATQRYNRAVNVAVLDETSRRFLCKGASELEALEQRIKAAENVLHETQVDTLVDTRRPPLPSTLSWRNQMARNPLSERYKELKQLERQVSKFCEDMSIEQQPSKKLFDAILKAKSREPLVSRLTGLVLEGPPKLVAEKRVILEGQLARIRIQITILTDQLRLLAKSKGDDASQLSQLPNPSAKTLLQVCEALVKESSVDSLPRLAVLSSLMYAKLAISLRSSYQARHEDARSIAVAITMAQRLLDNAEKMCDSPFEGAEKLRKDVEGARQLLGREWYDPVTTEELVAIKAAMVGGPRGMASHSGHWYKCPNGHTVALSLADLMVAQTYTNGTFPVRHRRVRHADGAGSVPRMWSSDRRP